MTTNGESQASTDYKEAFSLFDKRGTGRVPVDDLGDLLRACGQNPTLSEVRDLEKNVGGECMFLCFFFLPLFLFCSVIFTRVSFAPELQQFALFVYSAKLHNLSPLSIFCLLVSLHIFLDHQSPNRPEKQSTSKPSSASSTAPAASASPASRTSTAAASRSSTRT